MRYATLGLVLASLLVVPFAIAKESVWLDSLDVSRATQEFGQPRKNKSVDRHPLRLGAKKFEHGLGTHANSVFVIDLDGSCSRFSAMVGVDDEVGRGKGTVVFEIYADKKKLWDSGLLKGGDAAKQLDVGVSGVKRLSLNVSDAGDGIEFDHADWADAKFTLAADSAG